jgi:hypothetical protein
MIFRRMIPAAPVLLLLAMPMTAQAADDEPVHLKPQSPWQLDYADSRCRLGRYFGEGDEKTVFWLEQYGPSDGFTWLVAGPAIDRFRSRRETNVQFGPHFPRWQLSYPETTLEGFGPAISGTGPVAPPDDGDEDKEAANKPVGLPHLDAEAGRELFWLRLDQKFAQPVVLELGKMDKPFEAMNQCVEDLVAHWGVDVEAQKTRATPPQFTNIMLVARKIQEHYPEKAVRSGSQANFHLRILVGVNGQATDCTLTDITLATNFDMRRHPCRIVLDSAKFESARDVNGNPVASFYETNIAYRIGR